MIIVTAIIAAATSSAAPLPPSSPPARTEIQKAKSIQYCATLVLPATRIPTKLCNSAQQWLEQGVELNKD